MKKITYNNTIKINKHVLTINASTKHGCYVEILESLYYQMIAMLSHHNKVLFLRLDIRLHDYTSNNKIMTDFLRKIKVWLKRHYSMNRVGHVWVREQEESDQQHYHLILLLDGSVIQHPKRLISRIEDLASYRNMAKPYTPKNCFIMMHRHNLINFGKAFERGSYLAKVRGKGNKDKTTNDYSASRIKISMKLNPPK